MLDTERMLELARVVALPVDSSSRITPPLPEFPTVTRNDTSLIIDGILQPENQNTAFLQELLLQLTGIEYILPEPNYGVIAEEDFKTPATIDEINRVKLSRTLGILALFPDEVLKRKYLESDISLLNPIIDAINACINPENQREKIDLTSIAWLFILLQNFITSAIEARTGGFSSNVSFIETTISSLLTFSQNLDAFRVCQLSDRNDPRIQHIKRLLEEFMIDFPQNQHNSRNMLVASLIMLLTKQPVVES